MPQILEGLGLSKDKEIITHCQTHHRSGFTYLVARRSVIRESKVMPVPGANGATTPTPPSRFKV
jgi:rhodanese-related sulfurtransferase